MRFPATFRSSFHNQTSFLILFFFSIHFKIAVQWLITLFFIQAQLPLMSWQMLYKGRMISFMQNKNKGCVQNAVKPLLMQENLLQLGF